MNKWMMSITALFAVLLSPGLVDAKSIAWAQPSPEAAAIVGSSPMPPELLDIEVYAINGENIAAGRETLWLEPGQYTLDVRFVSRRSGIGVRPSRPEDLDNTIELVVEAGKTYFLGGRRHREGARESYSVVVHRIKDRATE